MSTNPPAIADLVALAKVRHYLAGLKGFNPMPEAAMLFARTIQTVCVSVEHADATLQVFDDICPTPREIKDAAYNCRHKFEAPVDQRKQWEAQYGPPDPQWSENLIAQAAGAVKPVWKKPTAKEWEAEKRACRLQAIRDTVYYTETQEGKDELNRIVGKQERTSSKAFWADARAYHERNHPEELNAIRAGREPEIPQEAAPTAHQRITPEMM